MNKLLSRLLVVFTIGSVVSACGGSNSNGSTTAPVTESIQVTIDAMTDVPVLRGNPTQGALYIHNHGSTPATGVSFSLGNATLKSKLTGLLAKAGLNLSRGIEDNNGFILQNVEQCGTIPAHGSCTVNFSTPSLTVANKGNSLVTVHYKNGSQSISTSQVVNYSYVNPEQFNGLNFTGSLRVTGAQSSTQYVVGYLFGGGKTGQIYKNVVLDSSNPSTRVNNGFINGQDVGANQVIAVEFAVPLQNGVNSFVNITPQWGSSVNSISSASQANGSSGIPLSMTLIPVQNTVNYIFGNVPILNAPTESDAEINVVNNGNANATSGVTAVATGGNANELSIDDSDCATPLLADAVDSCTISFSVSSYNSGTTQVEFKDSNGSVIGTQQVVWTNDKPYPAVVINVTPITNMANPFTIGKGVVESGPITFTITNIGKAPLENVSFNNTITGPVGWTQESSTCPSSGSLGVNETCSIVGELSGTDIGTGTVYYFARGSYDSKDYNFVSLPLYYMIQADPVITITPADVRNMSIIANGESQAELTYTVTNTGIVPAEVTDIGLKAMTTTHMPVIDSSIAGSCSTTTFTLAENESCIVVVKYGPVASTVDVNESGFTNLDVAYNGGLPVVNTNAVSESLNYHLLANNLYIIESISATGVVSGDGSSDSHYYATAAQLATVTVDLRVNESANFALKNFNVNINNLPYGISVIQPTDCPIGTDVRAEMLKDETCVMTFVIDRDLLKTTSGSSMFNFMLPQNMSWTSKLGFQEQPGIQIYIDYLQPTVSFTLTGIAETRELTMTLINESAGISPFAVMVEGTSYWLNEAPVADSPNCSVDSSSYAINCSLSSANLSGVTTYFMPNWLQPESQQVFH